MRQRARWLYAELDQVRLLRKQAKEAVRVEGRRHQAVQLLRTIPLLGPVRAAQIVAIVDTPYRFRTKPQFWSYSGLAVVTHMSAEYEMQSGRVLGKGGKIPLVLKPQRGLTGHLPTLPSLVDVRELARRNRDLICLSLDSPMLLLTTSPRPLN